jgi:hypothetical protein
MRNISIKQTQFDNLILAYQAPNPRDHFYLKVFGKTYAEQKAFESKQYGKDKSDLLN